MSGTLYVVATPIGNLEDITLRALRVLREVDLIAAEDTRRSGRLLAHHGISTRTISFHEHNSRSRVPQLISRLETGQSIAIVTDAGTPGVSDPGLELVKEAIERDIRVDPIPGASAPLAALIASGFEMMPFTVFGFAPSRLNDRIKWLGEIAKTPHTFSFFEAPHRIQATLRQSSDVFGKRPIVLGRELTKVHQEFLRGTASELAERLTEPRGEFTIIVCHAPIVLNTNEIQLTDEDVVREFGRITELAGGTRRQAITEVARKSGRSDKDVYSAIERAKKLGA
jgi:16S rRNA (cytidine1402-2'-O)-methyltransferase